MPLRELTRSRRKHNVYTSSRERPTCVRSITATAQLTYQNSSNSDSNTLTNFKDGPQCKRRHHPRRPRLRALSGSERCRHNLAACRDTSEHRSLSTRSWCCERLTRTFLRSMAHRFHHPSGRGHIQGTALPRDYATYCSIATT